MASPKAELLSGGPWVAGMSVRFILKESTMCRRRLFLSVTCVLVCSLTGSATAQDVFYWTNAGGDGMWNRNTEPYNWERAPAWNPDARIPSLPPEHGSADVWISGNPATRTTPLVIPAGYSADCTYGVDYGTIFGPEWGLHLDIYGSLTYRWYIVLAQGLEGLIDPDNPDNDTNRSVLNMYNGSRIHGTEDSPGDSTRAEGIAIGTNWWAPLPYVTMNMYEGSECLVNWAWIGGHLNMYGGTFDVLDGVNMGIGTPENVPDELIRVDVHEGKLILPPDFSDQVQDWINRGILKAYGMTPDRPKGAQILVDTTTMPDRTIVTALPSRPPEASWPNPIDGATEIRIDPVLRWEPGKYANSHELYFGTDSEAVKDATIASPEYKGSNTLGDENYDPGKLAWEATYYWRVDEVNSVNPDSPWVGSVWSFTTGDFLTIDDFEEYTDDDTVGEALWQHWIDGFGVPGNGAQVGYLLPPYAERTIVHGGLQSLPLFYDNTAGVTNSEATLTLTSVRDWTEEGVVDLSLWFRGLPASTSSFMEGPVGTYTMTASGAGITGSADQFHFAYKMLTGPGSIVAKVERVQNTNQWAKAGVMIRETLDPGSVHAMACVTPDQGVVFEYRTVTGSNNFDVAGQQTGITAPHWMKLERSISGGITVYHSANGSAWEPIPNATMVNILMNANVYIGFVLTAHDADRTCEATFSNLTITGTVSPEWMNEDIGIISNVAERLYVAVSNPTGSPAVIAHEDPAAATIDTWTEWVIPLQAFANQGTNLANVDKVAIGLGSKGDPAATGGSGTMYIDDIRLYRPKQ